MSLLKRSGSCWVRSPNGSAFHREGPAHENLIHCAIGTSGGHEAPPSCFDGPVVDTKDDKVLVRP